jgi:glycosyltransferase involved in cell wall biosynthesis
VNQLPLISIIIPAYNAERWLRESCDSVLSQTYRNLELIVVDDGSHDGTYDILEDIAKEHSEVRVIHTENGGVCRARNTGLDAARGEYITFLDADDLMVNDALEKLYGAIIENKADISVGWKTNMRSDGQLLECPYQPERAVLSGTQGLEYSLKDHPCTYTVWGKLYRRSFIGKTRFVEGRRIHEDSFFVFQCCLKQPKMVLLDDILVQYRLSEDSASRAPFSEKFFDILYFAERKKALIEEMYPEYLALADNVLVKAHMALLKNLCKTKDRKYRAQEKNSIREIRKRRKTFVPAIRGDQQMFRIVTFHLYGVYKYLYYPIRNK